MPQNYLSATYFAFLAVSILSTCFGAAGLKNRFLLSTTIAFLFLSAFFYLVVDHDILYQPISGLILGLGISGASFLAVDKIPVISRRYLKVELIEWILLVFSVIGGFYGLDSPFFGVVLGIVCCVAFRAARKTSNTFRLR